MRRPKVWRVHAKYGPGGGHFVDLPGAIREVRAIIAEDGGPATVERLQGREWVFYARYDELPPEMTKQETFQTSLTCQNILNFSC